MVISVKKNLHMKNKFTSISSAIIFLLFTNITISFAQWETHGPYGGPLNPVKAINGNLFVGTGNGVFKSSDNGQNWTAANIGIQKKIVGALTYIGTNIFAGTTVDGIYLSANNGTSWAAKNNGLTNLNIISLFASGTSLFAGTANGVFFSSNNGNSWSLANNGIQSTYPIYDFAQVGNTIFGATYGLGLYSTNNNGGNWSVVGGGFPSNTFVYALLADVSTIYAGTSAGVYKSLDGGINWLSSNAGFPSGMWAKSFAIKPGYIYAGTYSEGVFVSTNNGNSWTQVNNGIPDLPFPTGLPHNYPSVDALTISGSNVLAASANGMYISLNNGNNWNESNEGILGVNVTAITSNNNIIFAGTDRTGIYVSTNKGVSWSRANNGLTSYNVLALTTTNSNAFVSLSNSKVFRSNNNGTTWTLSSTGLPAPAAIMKSDSLRVIAITTGLQYTPPALLQTINNGSNWTMVPVSGFNVNDMTALGLKNQYIYVGTTNGNLFRTNNNGVNWQNISTTLPSAKITAILPVDSLIYVGIEGQGVYKSNNSGSTWTQVNAGITNNSIKDIIMQNSMLYAATWGGGVFTSNNFGASWTTFNANLDNLYVSNLTGDAVKIYAGTDAGAYSHSILIIGIQKQTNPVSVNIYPNPGSGIFYFTNLMHEKIQLKIYDVTGKLIYNYEGSATETSNVDLSGKPKGIYFLNLQTKSEMIIKKIVVD